MASRLGVDPEVYRKVFEMEPFTFVNGKAHVHGPKACKGQPCVIHNHSEHKGGDLPMLLRETGLVEHICDHGIGHPCPDSWSYFDKMYGHKPGTWGVHGCDGCTHEGA